MNGKPVTVHENELAIVEEGYERLRSNRISPKSEAANASPSSVPVQSGLAAADQLNQRGHDVTVFERDKKPGGLLRYGIPNMKLEKRFIDRRVAIMEAEGVRFRCGINVVPGNCETENSIGAAKLEKDFDAVIICAGAKQARDLSADGRDADGIVFAVDFLSDATRRLTGEEIHGAPTAEGKNVIIVGGGDTGNDCVGTSIRQGCKSVLQLEMMPKSPDERAANNPWPQWPRVCQNRLRSAGSHRPLRSRPENLHHNRQRIPERRRRQT